tara:strand:- start:4050 stop:7796 length:3747 start_codon:yes stop_codon:yes gene_type:complete
MPTKVDHSSVFDTVLPNIYIKRVSLLPASAVGRKRAQDFDESKLYEFQTNEFGKKSVRAQSKSYKKRLEDPRNLMISVDLVIKDDYLATGKSRWFDDEELIKFLKIRVVLCRDPNLSEELLKRRFTPRYLKKYRSSGKFLEQIISIDKFMGFSVRKQRKEKLGNKTIYSTTVTATFNVTNYNPDSLTVFAHAFTNQNEYMATKLKQTDSKKRYIQGNTAAEKIIENSAVKNNSYVYTLPNRNVWAGPVHYHKATDSYMAGISHTSEQHPKLKRQKMTNFVIEDHRLLNTLATEKLQLHPARKTRNRRTKNNKNAHELSVISSEAYISEPLYSFDSINRLKMLFNINFDKIVSENTQYGAILKTADRKAKSEIFSQCKITNLSVYRHRVEPGLNRGEVREVDYDDRTELIGYTAEKNAGKLLRNTINRKLVHYDEDSEEVLAGAIKEITLASNMNTGVRSIGVTDYDMSKITDGLYRYSVEMQVEDGTVAFIKAQSAKLAQARKSLERYLVDASMMTSTGPAGGHFSAEFADQQKLRYPTPGMPDLLRANRAGRKQQVQTSISSAPWINSIAIYLDVLYNLTGIHYTKVQRGAHLLQMLCDPSMGSDYGLGVLLELISKLEYQIRLKMDTTIKRMDEIDYNAETPAYKGKISTKSFTIKKYFNNVHNSNMLKNVGYDFLSGGLKKSIGPRRLTTQEFKKRMNAENSKYFNASFSDLPSSTVGPQGDAGSETSSYFTRGIDLQDKYYSFLTPAVIQVGDIKKRTINRTRGLWAPKQYNSLLSIILSMNPKTSSPMSTITDKTSARTPAYITVTPPLPFSATSLNSDNTDLSQPDLVANMANSVVLNSLSVAFSSVEEFEVKELKGDSRAGIDKEETRYLSPEDFLGEGTKFSLSTALSEAVDEDALEEVIANTLDSQEDLTAIASTLILPVITADKALFTSESRVPNIGALQPQNETNMIDSFFSTFSDGSTRKRKYITGLPNQVKAILMGSSGITKNNWFKKKRDSGLDLVISPELAGSFYFFFQHINQIEVLTGYQKDAKGRTVVSSPVYKQMTKEMFNRIEKNNLLTLCRMVPYSNAFLKFKKSQKLNLPEYDTHFVLGPRAVVKAEAADQPEEATVATTDVSQIQEEIYIDRLTEYSPLNTTGTKILKNMIKKIVDQDDIPPEFVSNAFIQQPYTATRVGTRFTSDSSPEASGDSQIDSLLRQRSGGQVGMVSPQKTTTRTAGSSGGGTSGGGTSGGGMSGGGGGY